MIKSKYAMLRLEDEVAATEAYMEIITAQLVELFNETDSEAMHRAAAGLIYLTKERRQALHQTYYAAHAEYAELSAAQRLAEVRNLG